jgi:hypothetical protein
MASQWLVFAGVCVTAAGNVFVYLATRANKARIVEVHSLVNNQLDRQLDRNAELTATLTQAGVDVPKQQTAVEPGPSPGA